MFHIMGLLVFITFCMLLVSHYVHGTTGGCRPHGLAKYKLTFEGHWSKEDFPKQYPLFRPNAQWSKLIGRSHSNEYNLFSIGATASRALKEFSELGTTTKFDQQDVQGKDGILDLFQTGPMKDGVGEVWATFFADEDHYLLSFASKIIPSPDWFVGSDNITLCTDDDWLSGMEVELFPIDAGTDKGFTFTSPNWGEYPFRPISQITSKFPSHQANSFFYPLKSHLPVMAKVIIEKLEQFELFEEERDEVEENYAEAYGDLYYPENDVTGDQVVGVPDNEELDQEEVGRGVGEKENQDVVNNVDEQKPDDDADKAKQKNHVDESPTKVTLADHVTTGDERKEEVTKEDKITALVETTTEFTETRTVSRISLANSEHTPDSVPTSSEMTVINNTLLKSQEETSDETSSEQAVSPKHASQISGTRPAEKPLNDYIRQRVVPTKRQQNQRHKKKRNQKRNGKRQKKHGRGSTQPQKDKIKPEKLDCILGEWGEWSDCSVSCGYGKKSRVRVVLQHPRNRGTPCRQYPEEDLCGTLRTCSQWKHFSFANWGIHLKK